MWLQFGNIWNFYAENSLTSVLISYLISFVHCMCFSVIKMELSYKLIFQLHFINLFRNNISWHLNCCSVVNLRNKNTANLYLYGACVWLLFDDSSTDIWFRNEILSCSLGSSLCYIRKISVNHWLQTYGISLELTVIQASDSIQSETLPVRFSHSLCCFVWLEHSSHNHYIMRCENVS